MKHYLKIAPLLFLLVLSISCKKTINATEGPFNGETKLNPEIQAAELQIGQVLATELRANRNLHNFIVDECIKQEQGDYTIRIDNLIARLRKNGILMSNSGIEALEELSGKMKSIKTGRIPIIFIPSAETVENKKRRFLASSDVGGGSNPDPYYFVPSESPQGPGDSYPGYVLNTSGQFVFYGQIYEEFAWENDVYVIGFEEVVSPENLIAIEEGDNPPPPNPPASSIRTDGVKEYSGRPQITDLGTVEPWIWGKLELKYFINDSYGGLIKEKGFGKRKRSHFRNQNWHDFNDFVGHWYWDVWGPSTLERWIEEDGGATSTVSTSFNPGQGLPSVTITHTIKSEDYNMGASQVQFSDPVEPITQGTIYQITSMNFKRKVVQ